MTKPTPIAVLFGGTGLIGRNLISLLVKAGYHVRVPTRNLEKAHPLRMAGSVGTVIPLRGCVRTDEACKAILKEAELVVNLIGITAETQHSSFRKIHVETAARLARLSKEAGVKTFFHFSAIGADAGSQKPFFRTKAMGEDAVKAFFPDAIIVRPSVVFGPKGGFLNNKMALWARFLPFLPLVKGVQTRLQPIAIEDIQAFFSAAYQNPKARGQTYSLAGPRIYTPKALWSEFREKVVFFKIPCFLLKGVAFLSSLWFWPPLRPDHIDLLAGNWVASSIEPKKSEELGVGPMRAPLP